MAERSSESDPTSTKRTAMKFYRKYTETVSNRLQRAKKYSLAQIISNRIQETSELAQLFKCQKSDLKSWRKVRFTLKAKGVRNFALQLGRKFRYLPHLDLSFDKEFFKNEDVTPLWILIGRCLRRLKYLSLNLKGCYQLNDSEAAVFIKQIGRNLKDLEGLSLNLADTWNSINFRTAKLLAAQGKKLHKLQNLSLNFKNCSVSSDSAVSSLAVGFKDQLKFLRSLKVHFDSFFNISDIGMTDFAQHIGKRCKNLESLVFNFSGKDVTDDGISKATFQIGTLLNTIKHLILNFSGCGCISIQGYVKLIKSLEANKNRLQSLSLIFDDRNDIEDAVLEELAQQFGRNFESLQKLKLSFHNRLFTDKGLQVLSTSIGENLRKLKDLDINLSKCKNLTNKGIIALTRDIGSSLVALESLSLYLTDLQPEDLQIIGTQLGTNLQKLRCLDLKLGSGTFNFENEAMIALVYEIATRFQDLETLKIDAQFCHISDEGLKTIANNLSMHLQNLKSLSFILKLCPEMTDQGVQNFMEKIVRTKQGLRTLKFGVHNCQNLTDAGFAALLNKIEGYFQTLREIKLDFSYCNGWKNIETVASEIENRLQNRGLAVSFDCAISKFYF